MGVCRFYNVELLMGKKVCLLCVAEKGKGVGEVGSGGKRFIVGSWERGGEPGEGGGEGAPPKWWVPTYQGVPLQYPDSVTVVFELVSQELNSLWQCWTKVAPLSDLQWKMQLSWSCTFSRSCHASWFWWIVVHKRPRCYSFFLKKSTYIYCVGIHSAG